MIKKFIEWARKVVRNIYRKDELKIGTGDIQVSDKMVKAIDEWFSVFYNEPYWKGGETHLLNFAEVMTNYMATIATLELTISAGKDNPRTEFIKEQIDKYVAPTLIENIQLAGVGGRVILKPYFDKEKVLCEAIPADRFYPTRINATKDTEAGYILDFEKQNDVEYVRVESFDLQEEGLYIHNEAYYTDGKEIKGSVPLSQIEKWKDLVEDVLIENVDRPLICDIRMPKLNTVDSTSKLPVSLYANCIQDLEALDLLYSSFLFEMFSGERRQIVDKMAMRDDPITGKPVMPYKKQADKVFQKLDMGENGKPFEDYTPELRVEKYERAIDMQISIIEKKAGFSPGTFKFDSKTGMLTATEVVSQDRATYNTIKGIQDRGIKKGLLDLVYSIDVYATLYDLAPKGEVEPSVAFGDSVFEDTDKEFARRLQMENRGMLKPEKFTSWYFGITEEEALEMMPDKPKPEEHLTFGE